ncbi:hypothetical protein CCR75_008765 [Bremia lactucae]|uniref:PHD-type domain-containing protein n=1 Tax=Bremia lactucae TaxID=4779 RepID=A0A976IEW6_BRELC|nr:hypothetical protein CCR75_008765 [Bremia lactucae]
MAAKEAVDCRADIPPMLSQEERNALQITTRCRQRWSACHNREAMPQDSAKAIEEFVTQCAWLKERELALECLYDGNFNVPKAAKLLRQARRERYKLRRNQDKILPLNDFKKALATYGKKFHLVNQVVGKSLRTSDIVQQYYYYKRSDNFRIWWRHTHARKTRKGFKEAERLRNHWATSATFQSYHDDLCDLCATGGTLRGCNGCPRAYHLSCGQPPHLKTNSADNWYCTYCQVAFHGPTPPLALSKENKYCMTYHRKPGFPRSLGNIMVEAGSDEDMDEQADRDCTHSFSRGIECKRDVGAFFAMKNAVTGVVAPLDAADVDKNSELEHQVCEGVLSSEKKLAFSQAELPTAQSTTGSSEFSAESSPIELEKASHVVIKRISLNRKRNRKMRIPRRLPPVQEKATENCVTCRSSHDDS